ncbi:hypothetical protein [Baaleninema sp.]|uniref:hypothetical protein n=1 Tax=Baaleninema sp. TaxID=3101197 RepID=UPI003CFF8250
MERTPRYTAVRGVGAGVVVRMAPPVGNMDVLAWQLLFDEMPIGAMLRNLGSLTQLGFWGRELVKTSIASRRFSTRRNTCDGDGFIPSMSCKR